MIDAQLSSTHSAAENKATLQNAILTASGKTIYIAEGVYAIDTLTITEPGTSIMLAPNAILQVGESSKYPAIFNIAASSVCIEGGQFEGSGKASISGIMAIRIYGSHSNITIRNCTVRNASIGIGSYNAVNCGNWLIENNIIETTMYSHGICLHAHPNNNLEVTGVRVFGNRISGTKGNGIWVGNKFTDVEVAGNHIMESGRMGIEVWRNPEGRFVIAENHISTCAWFGISIADTPYTLCSNNHIVNATSHGIEVAGSRFVTLANNHIQDVQAKPRTELQAKPRTELQAKPRTELQAKPRTELQAKPRTELQAKPRTELQAKESGAKPTGISFNCRAGTLLGEVSIQGGSISGCVSAVNMCGDSARRSNITISGLVIHNCVYGIRNVGSIGKLDGGGVVEHIVISGCVIHALKVGIGNSMQGGLIRGGVVSNNSIYVTEGDGIDLFRAAEVAIVSNRIIGTEAATAVGIRLRDHAKGELYSYGLLVENNLILSFKTKTLFSPLIRKEKSP